MIRKVVCEHHTQEYVARMMRVTQGTVSKLVNKATKKPEMIYELLEKREEEKRKREEVGEFIFNLNE